MEKDVPSSPPTTGSGSSSGESATTTTKAHAGMPVAKTAAEFKAHRLNLREQTRLDNLQAYLCRQERYCHKEFRTSTLKVQNHFKRRLSAAATALSPTSSPSPHHHLTLFPHSSSTTTPLTSSPFHHAHHKWPPWRRASEIPASSSHTLAASLLPEGMLQDKLQMRRQTYGGPVLSPPSLTPHHSPAFGDRRSEDVGDCPVCRQLAEMILFHLKENCDDSRNVAGPHPRNDRRGSQDMPSLPQQRRDFPSQRRDVLRSRDCEGNPHPQCEDFHNDRDAGIQRSVKSGGTTAAVMSQTAPASAKSSPREERRSEQVEVPLITVLDTDSAPDQGRKNHHLAPRFKATGERKGSHTDDPTNATDQRTVSRPDDRVHAPKASSSRFSRYSKLAAIAANFNKAADDVLVKADESRVSARTESEEKCDIQNRANLQADSPAGVEIRGAGGVTRNSDVSMMQASSPSSQRKPSLTPPSLTSPNKTKMTSSVLAAPNRMRSSSFAIEPHRAETTSSELEVLNRTRTTRSASLALPTQPPMASSSPCFPHQFSTPFSRHSSPDKTSATANTSAYDDVNFDEIILQHAKNCPAGERESIRRNSAILHSVQRTPSPVLDSPRSTSSSVESAALSTKPTRSTSAAVMMQNSRKTLNPLASSTLSKPSRTSSAAVLQNSRRTLNSQAFSAHSSGRMRNPVSALHDRSMKSAVTITTVVSRPLEVKVTEFLQQQTEFNKRFPLKDYEVTSLECVRPDLVPKSRDRRRFQQMGKEKRRMIAEVLDILGLAGIETVSGR